MAFTEISRWHAPGEQSMLVLRSWQRADRLWFNLGFLRKPLGLTCAITFHAAIGLLFLHYSHALPPLSPPQDTSRGLKLFTFQQEGEQEEPPTPEVRPRAGGAQAVKTAEAAIQDSPAAPAEWTMSRIRVARAAEAPAASSAAAPGPATPAPPSGSSGAGGSSGFDPYAGASPRRPGEMRASLSPGSGEAQQYASASPASSAAADNVTVQAFLVRELKIRFPDLKGSFLLAVQFDRRGQVSDIIVRRGQIDRSALRWLRGRLRSTDNVLAGSANPGALVDLPEIRLL